MTLRRADDNQYTLLANGTATGNPVAIKGGEYIFMAEGTAAGATISLQVQTPQGNWAPVLIFAGSAVSFTALPNSQTGIDLPAGNVRVNISGSPTGVYAYIIGLG